MSYTTDFGLRNRAMLVRLKVPTAKSTRKSKSLSNEIAVSHDADPDLISAVVDIMPKEFIQSIETVGRKLYSENKRLTLPWGDDNARILTTELMDNHSGILGPMIRDFHDEADGLVHNLPALIEAARIRLKTAFDPSAYPSQQALKSHLRISLHYAPIPESTDFRLNLDAGAIDYLKESLENDIKDNVEKAVASVKNRMIEVVETYVDRLSKVKNVVDEKGKPRMDGFVRSSITKNVQMLIDVVPGLNITGDPEITSFARELAVKLCAYEADTLNESEYVREAVLKQARDLLARMKR